MHISSMYKEEYNEMDRIGKVFAERKDKKPRIDCQIPAVYHNYWI